MSNVHSSSFAFRKYVECFLTAIFPYGLCFIASVVALIHGQGVSGVALLVTALAAFLFGFSLYVTLSAVPSQVRAYENLQEALEKAKNAKNVVKETPLEESPTEEEVYYEDDKVALDDDAEVGDFYQNNSFDPFLATLNENEKLEFIDLFLLRIKGDLPEIPDYKIDGDNRNFFLQFYIHLGQYRELISDALFDKIHQFANDII
ncbi:MAG: hypothetical protein J6S04_06995 [Clostridia bacterium]|nr:hypothetical protein [Clostridia bacterium]